jgi:hypothetical protein
MDRYQEIEIDGERILAIEAHSRIRKGEELLGIERANLDIMDAGELGAYLKELRNRWKQNVAEKPTAPIQNQAADVQGAQQLENADCEMTSDDDVWVEYLIDRLRQGRYPKHPLILDGNCILHDFKKCATTHIRYYKEATGVVKRESKYEIVSKKAALDGIKRLVELAEECEMGICMLRRKMPKTAELPQEKKFNDDEVERWIAFLEQALKESNYPTKPVPVPGKPYITIVDFEKCARKQIECYRNEQESPALIWHAGIVAERLRDLADIVKNYKEGDLTF